MPGAHPSGVFDVNRTMTGDDVLEMTSRSHLTKTSAKRKGKGKSKADAIEVDDDDLEQTDATLCDKSSEQLAIQLAYSYAASSHQHKAPAQCGICFDDFRITENPYRASISATSSSDRNKGLQLPCGHRYCLGCASQYLKTELEKGPGSEWMISCPEVCYA